MASYEMRVRTAQPADEVFAYLSDLRNFAEWDPGTTSAVQVEGDGPGLGASYDLQASGQRFTYTVTAYDEVERRVEAEAPKSWVTSHDTVTVAVDGTDTVATYHADLRLTGVLKVGDPILQLLFNRIGAKAADGLTEQLAGRRVA